MLVDRFVEQIDLGMFAWVMPLFYFALTIASYAMVFFGKDGKQGMFFARMSGAMLMRMFFCVIFIIIYLYFSSVTNIPIVIYFMFLYFIYTSFEIYDLVYKLRAEKTTSLNAKNP